MTSRYSYPEFLRLDQVRAERLHQFQSDAEKLLAAATCANEVGRYADSWVIDLTSVDLARVLDLPARWAGSSSNRAHQRSKYRDRLKVRRLTDPSDNDIAHNSLRPWVDPECELITYLRGLGDVRKMSLGCLLPGGWWPTHYDFTPDNGFKVNLVLSTNAEAVTMLWNARRQQLIKKRFELGDLWYLNVGLKHTAHNWGSTPRLFALATYKSFHPEWQCKF